MLAARFKQAVAAGGVVPLGARCHGIEESLLQGEAENHQQGSESGVGVVCVCWGTSHFLLLPAACLCTLCCLGSEECNREKASNSQGTGSISMNGFSSLWREGH